MLMSSYPLILIPDAIALAKVVKPASVGFESASEPRLTGEPPAKMNGVLVGVEIFAAIALTKLISLHPKGGLLSFVFFFLASSAIGFHIWRQIKSYPRRAKQYAESLQDYQRTITEQRQNLIEKEEEAQRVGSSEYLEEFRNKSVLDALNKTRRPRLNKDLNSQETKTKPEKYFLKYLNKFFSNKIYSGISMNSRGYGIPYQPDFIYFDSAFNLCIDIEIDEPYSLDAETNQYEIKHYLELGDDAEQNRYFLDNGWIIIRFSEEQAIKQPDSCCKVIAETIHSIIKTQSTTYNFALTPDLEKSLQWTSENAKEMVEKKHRENYLSQFLR